MKGFQYDNGRKKNEGVQEQVKSEEKELS